MNTKRSNPHGNRYGSVHCDTQLHSGTAPGLSFHAGVGSSLPQAGSWLCEEHISTPRSVLATQAGNCVGFAFEHLLDMARFGGALGSTTVPAMAALRTTAFDQSPVSDQLYPSIDPPQLSHDSVMTYRVPPRRRDAPEAEESPPFKMPLQQLDRLQSTATLLGREHKILSISPRVGGCTLLPSVEATSVQQGMAETPFLTTCNITTPTTMNTGKITMTSRRGVLRKTRIRWTKDLHERFVDCVNQLGGADKATPKGILKLMKHVGLTVYHIKSHLQKYRITKYITASSKEKKEKRVARTDLQNLYRYTGTEINEALRVQLEVQRRLDEQIEIQTNLQLRVEAQGKMLQRMLEQLKASRSVLEPREELQAIGDTSNFLGEQLEEVVFDDFQLL